MTHHQDIAVVLTIMIPVTGAAGCCVQNAFIAVFDWAFWRRKDNAQERFAEILRANSKPPSNEIPPEV